jgi:hypothetical protein
MKMFAVAVPVLATLPNRVMDYAADTDGVLDCEPYAPVSALSYDGPPMVIGFEGRGIHKSTSRHARVGLRRPSAILFEFDLNIYGGSVSWGASPWDAIVVLPNSPVNVYTTDKYAVASALVKLPGVLKYQVIST